VGKGSVKHFREKGDDVDSHGLVILVTCYLLLVTGYWLLVTCYWLLVI
jgi:hypothetical protein